MASAAAVIANGGYWMRPYIVKKVEEPSGELVREFQPMAERKVIEPETADRVMALTLRLTQAGAVMKLPTGIDAVLDQGLAPLIARGLVTEALQPVADERALLAFYAAPLQRWFS